MDSAALLTALQYADSFFPSGSVSFSWGLEALKADREVRGAEDVGVLIAGQLRHRWATCDRAFVARAHAATNDLDAVMEADNLQEAMALPRELREGSRRMGAALLGVHARLGTRRAGAYRERVRAGAAPGHVSVVQGLTWRSVGLSQEQALAASAHGLCVGLLGAALRLGLIGHVECQSQLTRLRHLILELLATPVPSLADVSTFIPATDVAMMRHEVQAGRLFAN